MKIKKYILILVSITTGIFSLAQQLPSGNNLRMSSLDSIYLSNISPLTYPEKYKERDLPYKHDNSIFPYLRPVFEQDGACCGQAASLGYNFTYEIDRLRDVPANLPENQYPTHFAWNFMNWGAIDWLNWWETGSSYFHSFELLKVVGCPTVEMYGGMSLRGDSTHWMTGYENYYQSMHNRIEGVYAIDVSTEEGLLMLKQWVFDHLDGSEVGGVANFYTGINIYYLLPTGTPEENKAVIVNWWHRATHALTIVGYNDSIRWDRNFDGRYTNDEDINNDGIIDMKDWEIGGIKFVNSYNTDWGDDGFCYALYSTLAETYGEGGIWNNTVHVIKARSDYEPLLTMKVILKHSSRDKIKVTAGISTDTTNAFPEFVMDFPIVNYQGGAIYMQGGDEEDDKTIEIGFDITPLLSYINNGAPARFFFIVNEEDPLDVGTGEIIYFSVIDYTDGVDETINQNAPVPLSENDITSLSIIKTIQAEKVVIVDNALPPAQSNEMYQHQFTATGGTLPYKWKLKREYPLSSLEDTFPMVTQENLTPDIEYNMVAKNLDFSFPFYGQSYDSVILHTTGFLMFDGQTYPWPYYKDLHLLLTCSRSVSPFLGKNFIISPSNDDGIWYEGNNEYAIFRWQVTDEYHEHSSSYNFAVKLYPTGRVEFYYDDMIYTEPVAWIAGISDGDQLNYTISSHYFEDDLPTHQAICFLPPEFPLGMSISKEGLFQGVPDDLNKIYDITIKVEDENHLSNIKTFQLASNFHIDYNIIAGDNNLIERDETVFIDITLKNIGLQPLQNGLVTAAIDDPYTLMLNDQATVGLLSPGDSITIYNAISFQTSQDIPDMHPIQLDLLINTDTTIASKKIFLTGVAPMLSLGDITIYDDDNGILTPGESAEVHIKVNNSGHADAFGVINEIIPSDPYISIDEDTKLDYGNIQAGSNKICTLRVTANQSTPNGHIASFNAHITDSCGSSSYFSFELIVGKTPILIVDLDGNLNSGVAIKNAISAKNINVEYKLYLPYWELYRYDLVFLCLGVFIHNYELSFAEGNHLADYLLNGGQLYMEGGMTWFLDDQTAVHGMFGIEGNTAGWATGIDTLDGRTTTFTENLSFIYSGENIRLDNLVPIDPSFLIFADRETGLGFAVAQNADTYKTIGTSFEFGGLSDATYPSTKNELMYRYLEFFDIHTNVLAANFLVESVNVLKGDDIQFQNISSENAIAWSWTFPGGYPATSTLPEPIIRYDSIGSFDVTLTVSDGVSSNTLIKSNYINVNSGTGIDNILLAPNVYVFPNPTNGNVMVTIQTPGKQQYTMRILNNLGQQVYENHIIANNSWSGLIDLHQCEAGIYYLILSNESCQISRKLILQ
ncbi:MAG: T9SS type A sorting domain-containing protein [Bacteroidales bacterium]|nr:T9SS type A sorting domain-containing protein [Bacteroidales bacterium]